MNFWKIAKLSLPLAALNSRMLITQQEITHLKFIFIKFSHIRYSSVIIQLDLITFCRTREWEIKFSRVIISCNDVRRVLIRTFFCSFLYAREKQSNFFFVDSKHEAVLFIFSPIVLVSIMATEADFNCWIIMRPSQRTTAWAFNNLLGIFPCFPYQLLCFIPFLKLKILLMINYRDSFAVAFVSSIHNPLVHSRRNKTAVNFSTLFMKENENSAHCSANTASRKFFSFSAFSPTMNFHEYCKFYVVFSCNSGNIKFSTIKTKAKVGEQTSGE